MKRGDGPRAWPCRCFLYVMHHLTPSPHIGNPFRESGPPACMAKLTMMCRKVCRDPLPTVYTLTPLSCTVKPGQYLSTPRQYSRAMQCNMTIPITDASSKTSAMVLHTQIQYIMYQPDLGCMGSVLSSPLDFTEKVFQGNVHLLYLSFKSLNALLNKLHFLLHPPHVVVIARRKPAFFRQVFISNILDSSVSFRQGLGLMRSNSLLFAFKISPVASKSV
jgi:hypothetical protein